MSADQKPDELAALFWELRGITLHDRPVHEVIAERLRVAGWANRKQTDAEVAVARREALKEARRIVASVTVLGGSSLAEGGKIAVQECVAAVDRLIALVDEEDGS